MADVQGSRAVGVEQVLYLLDDAFEVSKWHSLLGNLAVVRPEDWLWVPEGGRRSIRDIVQHVAGGKLLYTNYAFGSADLRWDDPSVEDPTRVETLEAGIEWLRSAHKKWREGVASLLSDEELLKPRPHFHGVLWETRRIIATVIGHDLYHAGEINHIRCLRQGDDE